jgi:predicted transposase YbfD/YdcC
MVSAWATANHLVLGEVKVADTSNEITAVPELLRLVDVHDCIVTLDALGCHQDVATQIIAQQGDYALAGYPAGVKGTKGACIAKCRTVLQRGPTAMCVGSKRRSVPTGGRNFDAID